MYLCVCHAITTDQVTWAVAEQGADSAEAVFESLGARPECRRCLGFLEEAVLAIRAGEPVGVAEDPLATPWGCRGRCQPAWGAEPDLARAG